MSRTFIRCFLALLALNVLSSVAARGDDGQTKATNEAAPSKTAATRREGKATSEPKKPAAPSELIKPAPPGPDGVAANKPGKPISFMRDVAPILVENCIACHNPRKSESKYVMTTFTQFAKGGQQGEDITLGHGERATRTKVVLYIHDEQNVLRGDLHRVVALWEDSASFEIISDAYSWRCDRRGRRHGFIAVEENCAAKQS